MIITRSPLRITLGGGGTDLPSYYRRSGARVLAAAINKYVYVTVFRPFRPGVYLKYAELEAVPTVAEVRHPLIREALEAMDFQTPQIEITSLADIPAGTGLGSSSSFTTALLKALHLHRRRHIDPRGLAEMACHLEIDRLRQPIGKQDQYIAAIGGISVIEFHPDDSVTYEPLQMSMDTQFDLEDHLLLFFTGKYHSAGDILQEQDTRSKAADPEMLANLDVVRDIGDRSIEALKAGETARFGRLLHEHWQHKRKRSKGMTDNEIDQLYELGLDNGAVGGKLVGAGGGGFLMFYAADRNRLRSAMARAGLDEVRFGFDFEGTKALIS